MRRWLEEHWPSLFLLAVVLLLLLAGGALIAWEAR